MHGYQGEAGVINWEIGIDIHSCIKQLTNEKLLYTTGNTQCSVVTSMGNKFLKIKGL